jgi:FkbM family methyltransferase
MAFLRSFRPRLTKIEALAHGVSWADAISLSGTKTIDRAEANVSLRMINRRVIIRPGTSDLRCLSKVFVDHEYAIPFEINPRLIVDAGANIGLVTVYFSGKFPAAKIIAIEPEQSNYDLLVRNCSGMANVTLRRAAVWNSDTPLQIENPNAEKWAFRVTPATRNGSGITALTIPQILAQSNHDTIDILKLDIEGAERDLFRSGCEEWLPRVKIIIIEFHDRFAPGCSRAVYSKLCQMPFRQETRGQNVFILLGAMNE